MTESSFQDLGNVQRTMVIPLFARAKESLRANPIVLDKRAGEILAEINYDTAELEKQSDSLQVVACVAANIFDRWTKQFLAEHPDGTIVEIGSGLDTRFERLDNGRAQWFDIDLPDSIAVRRQFFEEMPRRRMIAGSILEEGWIEEVKSTHPTAILFVAEGVLFYFKEEDVKTLYGLIANHFPGSRFAHDSCVKGVAEKSGGLKFCQVAGARFQWGIDDIHEVEQWDPRYKVVEVDSVLNHYRSRYPIFVRFFTWLIPNMRRVFTTNLVKLG